MSNYKRKATVVPPALVSDSRFESLTWNFSLTFFIFFYFRLGKVVDETNNTLNRGCKLGDQFHKAGSSWHPYLPPNGFDTCAVCTCDASTLEITCPRVQCPLLTCSEKVQYRQDKKACCKRCPEVSDRFEDWLSKFLKNIYHPQVKVQKEISKNTNTEEIQRDQQSKHGTLNSPTIIMSTGGCKSPMGYHANGADWHPIIASHGEQKCIKCKCKVRQSKLIYFFRRKVLVSTCDLTCDVSCYF